MPVASMGLTTHYHYEDTDTDMVDETPPVQNTWYENFDAEDVRLIWYLLQQDNDEAAAKDVEVRWTIDGNPYLLAFSAASGVSYCFWRSHPPSPGGLNGQLVTTGLVNAGYHVDKRGQAFKTEVQMTGAPGTNQRLRSWAVKELETVT